MICLFQVNLMHFYLLNPLVILNLPNSLKLLLILSVLILGFGLHLRSSCMIQIHFVLVIGLLNLKLLLKLSLILPLTCLRKYLLNHTSILISFLMLVLIVLPLCFDDHLLIGLHFRLLPSQNYFVLLMLI